MRQEIRQGNRVGLGQGKKLKRKTGNMPAWAKRALLICLFLGLLGFIAIFGINAYVKASVKNYLISEEEAGNLEGVDCALVLGCLVRPDGNPSQMLRDRVNQGIHLYQTGAVPKVLMSGDHGQTDYDEVNTMKRLAVEAGIPSEDVFMDHAGFSTYESMYRARDVFQADKIIIVTQEYHLYRAIYAARKLGLDAYGVASDPRKYGGQAYREVREILARNKDFLTGAFKPEPTYLGEAIPVSGDGDLTND